VLPSSQPTSLCFVGQHGHPWPLPLSTHRTITLSLFTDLALSVFANNTIALSMSTHSQNFRNLVATSRGNCSYSVNANNRVKYSTTCSGILVNPAVYPQGLMQVGVGGVAWDGAGGGGVGWVGVCGQKASRCCMALAYHM
jgi:hypothetical protein